ncbi:MAG: glycoside hydrolase family 3 C-terminal domain-containing protein [Candidatus Lokiarchaeota archaeon]|nr:glycoside hydrolase family 3 C-terminal domain-containing protein [Candidatus Lokiarchaeota archaeon]
MVFIDEEFGTGINNQDPQEIDHIARKYLDALELEEKTRFMQGDLKFLQGIISMGIRYNAKPLPVGKIPRLGIPAFKFTDGPRGIVMGSSTCFPVSIARGATFDVDLEERIGNAIGIEGRTQGADFFGGVCINLLRHPAWGRAQETYGEDPYHLGEMGSALTRGIQKHMMACGKHYCLNSMENMRFKVNVSIEERTLREIYLPHFKKCVKTGIAAIMSAYNQVNGDYCSENKYLLTDILKNDWNFPGFVITDFIWGVYDGQKAIIAGLDIEMPFSYKMKPKTILKWIESDKIIEERINDSVLRILKQKLRFAKKYDPELYDRSQIACQKHTQLAFEAAVKSMVLLQNKNKILPLNLDKIHKIAVFGNLADQKNIGDHGSSRVYPPYVVTPLMGIQQIIGYSKVLYDTGKNLRRATKLAKEADVVVIVMGYTHADEGEFMMGKAGDRDFLTLKPKDEDFIKEMATVNPNIIVVMEGGSAIIIEGWKDKVSGIIMAWYPGMEGGNALAHLLFGKDNFSGKLPYVTPKSEDQLPFFDKNTPAITYDYYHGYRLMDKQNYEPAYPFGFGLSYTTFSYGNPRIDNKKIDKSGEVQISVDVSNIGEMVGDEIVQIYVGYPESKVDRVVKELKAFTRIRLEPNETKMVTLTIPARETAFYDMNLKEWIIESGKYDIYVGSCADSRSLMKLNFHIL